MTTETVELVTVILADGVVDQISDAGPRTVSDIVNDLRDMGCDVKLRQFGTWAAAEAYADKVSA